MPSYNMPNTYEALKDAGLYEKLERMVLVRHD